MKPIYRRSSFCSALMLLFCFLRANCCAEDSQGLVKVSHQPLASNVKRVLRTLELLGQPLPHAELDLLNRLILGDDSERLQREFDQHVLARVTINPEERVSVQRGSAIANLQQSGYVPLIVKVLNFSTSTGKLRVSSPQSGSVFAGTSKLSMERQQQTEFLGNQNESHSTDRFMSVEFHQSAPMTPNLSGLEVEYMVMLTASSEVGQREAILQFDLGEGTADLEHRSELPVLFRVNPAVPVKLRVRESDGSPSIARVEFRDLQGRVYPSQAKRTAPDFFFQPHIYRADGETVLLPPGEFNVIYCRGPEYRVKRAVLTVDPSRTNELELSLERWFFAESHGFYGGDHHIHAAGCSHYTHPTEGVSPRDMYRQVWGEGLNVGCVLTWGPCFEFQRQYFEPEAMGFGNPLTRLKYDLEISGFGSQALGHVCLLNLKNQTYPTSEGTKTSGWPTWTTPVMRWAKEQGGVTGYAHSASGLAIDPEAASMRLIKEYDHDSDGNLSERESREALLPAAFKEIDRDTNLLISRFELRLAHEVASSELPNLAIPEMNGVGAMEICVSTVAGVCDFISAMDTRRIQEWNTWYHLLNCGFPLKVSGETDFPCMSSRRVGRGRVYVQLGEVDSLDFSNWCEGLAAGRSYVSDGFAHLPHFDVDGVAPGNGEVELSDPGEVSISAKVAFSPSTPVTVAQGTKVEGVKQSVIGDTVQLHEDRDDAWVSGGEREVELIVNGEVRASQKVSADGEIHELKFDLNIERSSWIALRQFPQLHSNPVNVLVGEKPIRASANSARWCAEMTKLLWENRHQRIAEIERDEAERAYQITIERFQSLELECVEEDGVAK